MMMSIGQDPIPNTLKEQLLDLIMNPENAQLVVKTLNRLFEIRSFLLNKPKMTI